ncbi:uncharacterized protein LOC8279737 [Ricinus communis]|uniref:uncharacterized protein LOC8279737 n=1 Tax=Ricinus communis TaxID=3988 RepID=UPI00077249F4|nr:uncharacterized protein LOC8279737 [Ricinus communis]|eukprot:XP_015584384.1 uncharacterized protein LOC8279737 [Ricinus communis]
MLTGNKRNMTVSSKSSSLLLLLLLVLTVSLSQKSIITEARTLSFLPEHAGKSKIFATLGIVCKCCDGNLQGECTSTWKGTCRKLQCLPWKIG